MVRRGDELLDHQCMRCDKPAVTGCCGRLWCRDHGQPHLRGVHSYNQPLNHRLLQELESVLAYAEVERLPPPPPYAPLEHQPGCAVWYTGMCNCPLDANP